MAKALIVFNLKRQAKAWRKKKHPSTLDNSNHFMNKLFLNQFT